MSRSLSKLASAVRAYRLLDPETQDTDTGTRAAGFRIEEESKAARRATADEERDRELLEYGYNLYNTMDQGSPRTGYRTLSRWGKQGLKRLLGPVLVQQTRWNRAAQRMLRKLEDRLAAENARLDRIDAAQRDRRLEPLERRLTLVEEHLASLRDELQYPVETMASSGFDYASFEDRFRGSREEILARQRPYVDVFRDHDPVLDLGCGRGELLELLAGANIPATGVDRNPEMVQRCHERGLSGRLGSALEILEGHADGTLGGIAALHLVEHLPPLALPRLVQACFAKLRPGGALVFETPNPRSVVVLSEIFYLDLTHVRPVPPKLLQHLLETAGFAAPEVRYLAPVAAEDRLPTPPDSGLPDEWQDVLTQALERIDRLLFGEKDYAVIAHRPRVGGGSGHPGDIG